MKTVILSAGQGKRLLPLTEDLPKCLLPLGSDTTLLAWQLSQLAEAGADEVVVVTGFGADKVEDELDRRCNGVTVRELYNPFHGVADNLISVWRARGEMTEDFILLNGDTLFEAPVVTRLLDAPHAPITVTISRKGFYDADDMKVRLDGERLIDVGKELDLKTVDAESIGIMLFRGAGVRTFREAVGAAVYGEAATRLWYLSVIDSLAKEIPIATAEVTQDEWCEVDYPGDLCRAQAAFRRWTSARSRLTPLDAGSIELDAAAIP